MNFLDRLMHPEFILYSLPGILIGLVLHELAHAFVADRLGDPTPRMMGRLTLNPLPHIDPIGLVMLIVAGFGWAKPVMTNPARYKIKRYGFALVGIAGPLTNLILGILFLGGYYLLLLNTGVGEGNVFANILLYAVYINFALCAFNLIPIPPLDGFNILKDAVLIKFIDPKYLWNFERYGQIALLALLFTGAAGWYISFMSGALIHLGNLIYIPIFHLQ
jgi:Zn-dependent protease